METAVRRRPWCAWLAVTVLAVLLLMPATGWVVASQLRGTFLPFPWVIPFMRAVGIKETVAPVYGPGDVTETMRLAAAQAPNDVGVQIAQAGWVERPEECLAATRAVALRFPQSPEARAASLREACRAALPWRWRSTSLLDPPVPQAEAGKMGGPGNVGSAPAEEPAELPSPTAVAAFLSDADGGERVDPSNAFFPLMRAVALFEAGRDDEGLAALHRAAALPRYDDYTPAGLDGTSRLSERVPGWRGTLPRLGALASTMFPHLSRLRQAARVATALAVQAELAGRRDEGLVIRRDLMRAGALVRVQSTHLFASLAGSTMSRIALLRPGGAPAIAGDSDGDRDEKLGDAQAAAFCVYLARIGHGADVPHLRGTLAGARQVRQMTRTWKDQRAILGLVVATAGLWLLCLFLLSNALWMLVLGGWAALAGRARRVSEGRRLTWLGWVTAPFALALLGLGGFLQTQGGRSLAVFVNELAFPVTMCMGSAPQPWSSEFRVMAMGWPAVAAVFPLASALVFGAMSLWHRVPLTVGLARGFRGMAVPVACFLVVLYAGAAIATARVEARADAEITAYTRHEGRYVAAKVACEWPGEVAGESNGVAGASALPESGGCH